MKENSDKAVGILQQAGIKPTSNRILILKILLDSHTPLGLIDIESALETVERSSISRVLSLFLEHDVIHALEDGRGVTRYEICHSESGTDDDMHAHFYCEACNRIFCFEDIKAPRIPLPEGFRIRGVNYMLKGLCPSCSKTNLY